MVSMSDIAKKLNLSRTSVSNILNNKKAAESYKPETIAIVKETAKEMGYIPNNMAVSLMRGSTMTIAVVVPDLSNTYYVNIIKELEQLASKNKYQLYIFTSEESLIKENLILDFLTKQRIDGLLIAPVSYKKSFKTSNYLPTNIVCFDRSVEDKKYLNVTIDNVSYAKELIEKNVCEKYDKVIFLAGSKDDKTVVKRIKGVEKSLNKKQMGIDYTLYNIYNDQDSYNQILKLFNDKKIDIKENLLFVLSTTYFSLGIIKSLKELNVLNYKLLGFEKVVWSEVFDVNVQFIDQPLKSMADKSFELLIKLIKQEDNVNSFVIPLQI